MDRRLIDYKPELELGGAAAETQEMQETRDEYDEMSFAARLLEAETPAMLADVLKDLAARGGDDGLGFASGGHDRGGLLALEVLAQLALQRHAGGRLDREVQRAHHHRQEEDQDPGDARLKAIAELHSPPS